MGTVRFVPRGNDMHQYSCCVTCNTGQYYISISVCLSVCLSVHRSIDRTIYRSIDLSISFLCPQTAADSNAHRLAHDLDLAKKIAQEREVAIDELCQERDRLHQQLQQALRENQIREQQTKEAQGSHADIAGRGSSVSGSAEESAAGSGVGAQGQEGEACQQCESLRRDNKQLFQDNQKLFRDNKKMTAELKTVGPPCRPNPEP